MGGEVRFDSYVTDIKIENKKIKGLVVNGDEHITTDSIILATGHSARDIYYLLDQKNVYMMVVVCSHSVCALGD